MKWNYIFIWWYSVEHQWRLKSINTFRIELIHTLLMGLNSKGMDRFKTSLTVHTVDYGFGISFFRNLSYKNSSLFSNKLINENIHCVLLSYYTTCRWSKDETQLNPAADFCTGQIENWITDLWNLTLCHDGILYVLYVVAYLPCQHEAWSFLQKGRSRGRKMRKRLPNMTNECM